jgi:hypothetical protein
MVDVREELCKRGIVGVSNVFSDRTLKQINDGLDEHFRQRKNEFRGYAHAEDLESLGLLDLILNDDLISLFFGVMDAPVVFHLLVNEIAAQQNKSHVFGDDLSGWHRDLDTTYEPRRATHVSFFLYLTDVSGPEDAPFEFIPGSGERNLEHGLPVVQMTGKAGTAFFWHRHFLHRAAPNRGSRRRRLLKISIQANDYQIVKLDYPILPTPVGQRMRERDETRKLLFGAYQGTEAPRVEPIRTSCDYYRVEPTVAVDVKRVAFIKNEVKSFLRRFRPGAAAAERSRHSY